MHHPMRHLINLVEGAERSPLREAVRRRKAKLKQPYSDRKVNPNGSRLIYHWIDGANDRWFDIRAYDILPKGDWTHNIPGIGAKTGVSFAYDPHISDSGDIDNVCFVLDRSKVRNEIWDIPMQEVYAYTGGDYADKEVAFADTMTADPDEAFAVGDVSFDALVEIIMKPGASVTTRKRVEDIAQQRGIKVKRA